MCRWLPLCFHLHSTCFLFLASGTQLVDHLAHAHDKKTCLYPIQCATTIDMSPQIYQKKVTVSLTHISKHDALIHSHTAHSTSLHRTEPTLHSIIYPCIHTHAFTLTHSHTHTREKFVFVLHSHLLTYQWLLNGGQTKRHPPLDGLHNLLVHIAHLPQIRWAVAQAEHSKIAQYSTA